MTRCQAIRASTINLGIQVGIWKNDSLNEKFTRQLGTSFGRGALIRKEMEHVDQWVEAWEVQQRVNLKLLEMVGEEGLKNSYAKRTREVSKVFSHIHNTRIMWLEALNMLPEGVRKIDKSADPKLDAIRDALQASSAGIVALIRKVMEKGKVAGFKRSPGAFVAYMIAHEAHHRGQVIVSMRISGHALVQEQIYSLWEWDKI